MKASMFEKPATDMAVGSTAVVTSLGILKGAVIRRTKDNLWARAQSDGRVLCLESSQLARIHGGCRA